VFAWTDYAKELETSIRKANLWAKAILLLLHYIGGPCYYVCCQKCNLSCCWGFHSSETL